MRTAFKTINEDSKFISISISANGSFVAAIYNYIEIKDVTRRKIITVLDIWDVDKNIRLQYDIVEEN